MEREEQCSESGHLGSSNSMPLKPKKRVIMLVREDTERERPCEWSAAATVV